MAVRIVRLGTARHAKEGLRLGTVRHPPRGVRKEDYARRDFFDVWLPELAPSEPLLRWARSEPLSPKLWKTFEQRYKREMRESPAQHLLALLTALSAEADFSVGCYCEDESHCHRSLLKTLLAEQGAKLAKA